MSPKKKKIAKKKKTAPAIISKVTDDKDLLPPQDPPPFEPDRADVSIVMPSNEELAELGFETITKSVSEKKQIGVTAAGQPIFDISTKTVTNKQNQPILCLSDAQKLMKIVKEKVGVTLKWKRFRRDDSLMTTIVNGCRYLVKNHIYQELPKD